MKRKDSSSENTKKPELMHYMSLAEEATSLDLGFDTKRSIWISIDKVILDAGKNVDAVYAKLVDEEVITNKGWRTDFIYYGCVIVHVFCKDPMPGHKEESSTVYKNTLLSPTGVTFLKAFMDLHFH